VTRADIGVQPVASSAIEARSAAREIRGRFELIAEIHGPFIEPLRRGEKRLDERGALAGRGIGHKALHGGGGGNAAGHIERDAADKLVVVGHARGRDVLGLESSEDKAVNETGGGGLARREMVATRGWAHGAGCGEGDGRAQLGCAEGGYLVGELSQAEAVKLLIGVTLALGAEHGAIGVLGGGGGFGSLVLKIGLGFLGAEGE
jgi:hypothetical protein